MSKRKVTRESALKPSLPNPFAALRSTTQMIVTTYARPISEAIGNECSDPDRPL